MGTGRTRARSTWGAVAAAVVVHAGALVMATPPAGALTTITVTTAADDGPGSLRQALLEPSISTADDYLIVIPASVGDITLTTGELFVDTDSHDLTVVGSGQTIRQTTPGERVLQTVVYGALRIEDLTLTGGSDLVSVGGGLYQHGDGLLTLDGVTVTGNLSGGGGGVAALGGAVLVDSAVTDNQVPDHVPAWGGGLYVVGDLTVIDSEITDNVVRGDGGGAYVQGDLTVQASTITGNEAGLPVGDPAEGHGGGAYTRANGPYGDGDVHLEGSTVSDNRARLSGGGLYSDAGAISVVDSVLGVNAAADGGAVATGPGGHVELLRSTLHDNDAVATGGGVRSGSAALTNVTLSGNQASRQGGGLAVSPGSAEVRFSTVVGNAAAEGASIHGPLTLLATVLAAPSGGAHCAGGAVTTAGWNLADDTSCALVGSGDQQSVVLNPLLGPLAANGGPTPTHLPAPDSPLIDGVATAVCLLAVGIDQRGLQRPVGPGCDIGAVEVQGGAPDPGAAPATPVRAAPVFTG